MWTTIARSSSFSSAISWGVEADQATIIRLFTAFWASKDSLEDRGDTLSSFSALRGKRPVL
jgi:hypothetical protein